jgi:hypothetical protein
MWDPKTQFIDRTPPIPRDCPRTPDQRPRVTKQRVHYVAVTQREPWQKCCDKCGADLRHPFFYSGKRPIPYRTICKTCHEKGVWERLIGAALYGPDPPDPRYA